MQVGKGTDPVPPVLLHESESNCILAEHVEDGVHRAIRAREKVDKNISLLQIVDCGRKGTDSNYRSVSCWSYDHCSK